MQFWVRKVLPKALGDLRRPCCGEPYFTGTSSVLLNRLKHVVLLRLRRCMLYEAAR